jgi:hypothetical protein
MNTTVTNPNFQLAEFPLNCEQCERLGYIFVQELEKPLFVICQICEGETSQVWCPKCEMGGSFVRGIDRHPPSWSCPNCHTKYSLPANFYNKPVSLFGIDELPDVVQERIQRNEAAARPKFTLVSLVLLLIYIVVILVLFLWPLLLGAWLLLKTDNTLWFFSGIVVMFAWLHFGRPLAQRVAAWLSNFANKLNESQ